MHRNHRSSLSLAALSALALFAQGCDSNSEEDRPYFDYCQDSTPKDECYAIRRKPDSEQIEEAQAIARRYMDEHSPEEISEDWDSAVLMFALTELHRVTGEPELRDYYKAYLDHHIEEGYEIVWSDSCPPALIALALLQEGENPAYTQYVDDVLDYLDAAPRTEEGGIIHLGTLLGDLAPGIWIDSLFMFGMVLNRHGEAADDADSLALMAEQFGIFKSLLQSESGLMVHANDWLLPFDTDIYWARGNSWVTIALAEYLRVLFFRGESNPEAEGMLQKQVAGVLDTQDPASGSWWTVMNRPGEPDNYLETSATALFAYGLARAYRYNLVGDDELSAAKRAVAAARSNVKPDEQGRPVVTGISKGTEPSTYEVYTSLEVQNDRNYGVGAVILALIETSGL